MPTKIASKLKKGDVVDVMGVEYRIESVEKDNADIDLWLDPTDINNPSFITVNAHPNTIVTTK